MLLPAKGLEDGQPALEGTVLPPETSQGREVAVALCAPDSLAEEAARYLRNSKAASTLRAYRSDWEHFVRFCEGRKAGFLPAAPETVALYLVALAATHRPATLTKRLTSIARAHEASNLSSPATLTHAVVNETLKGIRRTLGTAQLGKTPLLTADLLQILAYLPLGLLGIRDRALLLVGYAGGLRRSELAAATVADLTWVEEGAVLNLPRSKTDQEGQGRKVAIPKGTHAHSCPVQGLQAWLHNAKIEDGPIFRKVNRHGQVSSQGLHADSVGTIIKMAVTRAGFDPAGFAGHSLRAGFATQAARNGATAFDIMRQTGHRSVATVSRYIREAQIFRDSPASRLGL